eukprot:CAMPEP_0168381958 /NCGR_PEP_ID=MMETSP0228-20121227/13142_1 /TAXON_ID=133427 /ORGANISM="Protoceratium reticulatum, Strain CCCM 535 (=CCMP 1889)" /LENGTH=240 /DNA_ID=CAMNT_0008395067 /DNA_START=9 /DNA_END=731 /DNA_ORIENTATION=-
MLRAASANVMRGFLACVHRELQVTTEIRILRRLKELRQSRCTPSCSRRPPKGVGHALTVHVDILEGVEGHAVGPVLAPEPVRAVAVRLAHEGPVQLALDGVDLPHALAQEEVLAPLPKVKLLHALGRGLLVPARVVVLREDRHCPARQDLDGPVEAEPAVVDVASAGMSRQDGAKPLWKEDGVRVDLHDPVMPEMPTFINDSLPDSYEDPRIQRSERVAAKRDGKVDRDDGDPEPSGHRK